MSRFYKNTKEYLPKAKLEDKFIVSTNTPKKDFLQSRIYVVDKLYRNGIRAWNIKYSKQVIYLKTENESPIITLNEKDYEHWHR